MKKKIILIMFLIIPFTVHAKCSDAEKIRLSKLVTNVSYSYTYNESGDSMTYDVTITNLTKDFIFYDRTDDVQYSVDGELTIKGFKPNDTVKFDIYTENEECYNPPISYHSITFPNYNPYYKDELCKQAKGYMYCNKWVKMPYKYDEFKKEVTKFINEKAKKENKKETIQVEQKGIFDYLGEIYVKTYFIILPVVIIGCLVYIWKLNKKNQLF